MKFEIKPLFQKVTLSIIVGLLIQLTSQYAPVISVQVNPILNTLLTASLAAAVADIRGFFMFRERFEQHDDPAQND